MKRAFRVAISLAALCFSVAAQASTITYYHNDLLGSPMVATDSSGKVIWRESYRPYGERLVNDAAGASNDLWYAGRRQDASTGLVYMGARYYDPVTGRFVSKDPVAFDEKNIQSFNRYAYANDNPYKYRDPNGKSPLILWALGGYGAGVLADALSQYAAWHDVDWRLAMSSSAAQMGAMAGLLGAADGVGLTIEEAGSEAVSEGVGSGGSSIVAKDGTKITGITQHGVDRVIGDGGGRAGTRPEAILDALKNPLKVKDGIDDLDRPFKVYTGENARVVVNPETGKIVSTNPMSGDGAHIP